MRKAPTDLPPFPLPLSLIIFSSISLFLLVPNLTLKSILSPTQKPYNPKRQSFISPRPSFTPFSTPAPAPLPQHQHPSTSPHMVRFLYFITPAPLPQHPSSSPKRFPPFLINPALQYQHLTRKLRSLPLHSPEPQLPSTSPAPQLPSPPAPQHFTSSYVRSSRRS